MSWKVMEAHGRSRKVKEGHGWSFTITELRKVIGDGVGWWPVGLYCQPQSQSLSSGLWDLGLGFGTGLGLDKNPTVRWYRKKLHSLVRTILLKI